MAQRNGLTRVKVIHKNGDRTSHFPKAMWDALPIGADGYRNEWKEYEGEDIVKIKSAEGKTLIPNRTMKGVGDPNIPVELKVFKGQGDIKTLTQEDIDKLINDALEKERESLTKTIETLQAEAETSTAKVITLERDLQAANENAVDLENKLKVVTGERDTLTQAYDQVSTDLVNSQKDFATLNEKYNQLVKQVDQKGKAKNDTSTQK